MAREEWVRRQNIVKLNKVTEGHSGAESSFERCFSSLYGEWFFSLPRYLTTSYGTGQDIDERIVEGKSN